MLLQYLAFESPTLDLDITMFIQLGIFVLLLLFLRKFVLIPYLAAFDARDALTRGAQEDARKLKQEAEEARARYETERQAAYSEVEQRRKRQVAEASAEAASLIEKTRERVQLDIAQKQAGLEAELSSARKTMEPEIEGIAAQIAKKILG